MQLSAKGVPLSNAAPRPRSLESALPAECGLEEHQSDDVVCGLETVEFPHRLGRQHIQLLCRSNSESLAKRMSSVISKGPEFLDRTTDARSRMALGPGSAVNLNAARDHITSLAPTVYGDVPLAWAGEVFVIVPTEKT
ncbi:hypothetical protein AYO20_11195 [Fonsecaea nubica]|uniref:Uncharacterized protein n=1 Tax=Fonsecaea nubica TaxID=856822 RepID=A0A178BXL2_9EURO|nr:hypothetical protein AYO20_11195 [Fonsecaea nubica]OAL22370.1 hypothetical protein AYO20_11195 [Fonsecaea nubica]